MDDFTLTHSTSAMHVQCTIILTGIEVHTVSLIELCLLCSISYLSSKIHSSTIILVSLTI